MWSGDHVDLIGQKEYLAKKVMLRDGRVQARIQVVPASMHHNTHDAKVFFVFS
jgi:hypothetical protein